MNAFLSLFLDLLVKSVILTAVGVALTALMSRQSAANRHVASLTLFAVLLLLPMTKLTDPRWSVSLFKPALLATHDTLTSVVVTSTMPGPNSTKISHGPLPKLLPPNAPRFPWPGVVLTLWVVGVLFLLARRAIAGVRLANMLRQSRSITDRRMMKIAQERMLVSGLWAEIRESSECSVPLVLGFLRPVILFPVAAKRWDNELLVSALHHELGHVQRKDGLIRLLADLIGTLYWMNPLVWVAARQMRLAQEQACDDLVLNVGIPSGIYAGHLVQVVRLLQGNQRFENHVMAMAQKSSLEARVLAIVDAARQRSLPTRGAFWIGAGVAGVTLLLSATLQLCRAEDSRPPMPLIAVPGAFKSIEHHENVTNEEGSSLITINTAVYEVPEELWQRLNSSGTWSPVPGQSQWSQLITSADPLEQKALVKGWFGDNAWTGQETLSKVLMTGLGETHQADPTECPSVVVAPQHKAQVEIGQEVTYATDWHKDTVLGELKNNYWMPTKLAKKNVGYNASYEGDVAANQTVVLQMDLHEVRFEGFNLHDGPGRPVPVFFERQVQTAFSLNPTQVAILGGSARKDVEEVTEKSPILGDVPWVGSFFQKRYTRTVNRYLLLLVTAHSLQLQTAQTGVQLFENPKDVLFKPAKP